MLFETRTHFYRLQGKVMFLQASVILSTIGLMGSGPFLIEIVLINNFSSFCCKPEGAVMISNSNLKSTNAVRWLSFLAQFLGTCLYSVALPLWYISSRNRCWSPGSGNLYSGTLQRMKDNLWRFTNKDNFKSFAMQQLSMCILRLLVWSSSVIHKVDNTGLFVQLLMDMNFK